MKKIGKVSRRVLAVVLTTAMLASNLILIDFSSSASEISDSTYFSSEVETVETDEVDEGDETDEVDEVDETEEETDEENVATAFSNSTSSYSADEDVIDETSDWKIRTELYWLVGTEHVYEQSSSTITNDTINLKYEFTVSTQ